MKNSSPELHAPRPVPMWQKLVLWTVVALVLTLVFGLYLQPEFVVNMADYIWACF